MLSEFVRSGALPKRYEVTLADALRGDEAEAFASGTLRLRADSEPCAPALLEPLAEARRARVTLTEGRYHQVCFIVFFFEFKFKFKFHFFCSTLLN